jgi:VanZ family protein
MLVHSWNPHLTRWLLRDAVVNVALYVPLGMSAALAFRRQIYLPIVLGFLLSVSVELLQLFEPGRDSSAMDVVTNVAGTVAGVMLALLFERMAGPERLPPMARLAGLSLRDRSALFLLFVWTGYLLFPFFPVFGIYTRLEKVRIFLHTPAFAAIPLVSAMAGWFAAGRLMDAAGVRNSNKWLGLSMLAIAAQFFIVDHQPVLADLIGALAGVLLYAGSARFTKAGSANLAAGVFVAAIVFRGLSPFRFVPEAAAFQWIPFGGFLNTEWQRGIAILLEKSFYYGTAVWLLRACRVPLWMAGATVAVLLGGIEIAQIHLPGRTAELTDPLLSVVLAFTLGVLSRMARPPVAR